MPGAPAFCSTRLSASARFPRDRNCSHRNPPRRGERRCHPAPDRCCALTGGPRASPSDLPGQAPAGVGCGQRNDHEHERLGARLRVQPFPAIMIPAGTTASADFSTASGTLTSTTVPSHPTNTPCVDGHPGTPVEISPGKTSNLHRAPTASTQRPLDGHRASPCRAGSPGPPRLIRAARRAIAASHVFLGSRLRLRLPSHPASRRRSCH